MSLPPITSVENECFFSYFKNTKKLSVKIKSILNEQIHFITRPIQTLKIQQVIVQILQRNKTLHDHNGTYYIEIGSRSFAKLEIHERYIEIKSSGDYEAETIFFEVLRKIESSFLAIDFENYRCRWLKPIKETKYVYE